jgi:hypothetical protein
LADSKQSSTNLFFAHAIDANQFVARPVTVFQNDCALRDIQLVGQKTTQSGVSFPFHILCVQLYLNRAGMLAHNVVDLRVWDNVNTQSRHRRIVAGIHLSRSRLARGDERRTFARQTSKRADKSRA